MTYTHLTTEELVMIESYYHQNIKVAKITAYLKQSKTPIYNVINFLKEGHTALDYYQQYTENKKRCGRRKIDLPLEQKEYINEKVAQGWTSDVIIGRKAIDIENAMTQWFTSKRWVAKRNGFQSSRPKFCLFSREQAKQYPTEILGLPDAFRNVFGLPRWISFV